MRGHTSVHGDSTDVEYPVQGIRLSLNSTNPHTMRGACMRSSLLQISLEVGYAWMLLNLAIVIYMATHFLMQRAWRAWLRRRALRSAGPAPVVVISPR
jgi:hypothetical protein